MRSCVVVSILMTVLAVQARAQTESTFIYGIHDADPMPQAYLDRLNAAGVTGFVTATVAIGRDPTDMSGADFRPIANQGHTVICRLNYGYFPTGSLPPPQYYADFAQRCANFVANSQGCTIWHIGNEMNLASEWPEVNGYRAYVSPQSVAECFRLCYDAIKAVRPHHKVLSQPMAPWAGPYGGTPGQHDPQPLNWVTYLNQMLTAIANSPPGPHGTGPDGIALHINSRGYTYADIHSTQKVNAGGQDLYFSFYVYKDWINLGIPPSMWHLPLYATECNGNYYWKGGHPENPASHYEPGWMQEIYAEINRWNTIIAPAEGKPVFHCVNMYRWCAGCDGWNIDGASNPYRTQILDDLSAAALFKYRWAPIPVAGFTAIPLSGPAPLQVQFTDASTGAITSHSWSFGDGSGSSATHPSHVYHNPGVYTVSLTVSGPSGADTLTRTNYIEVLEPPTCIPYVITGFEGYVPGTAVMFRAPNVSGTTSMHLAPSPNSAAVTDQGAPPDGTRALRVQFAFVDDAPTRWLRLTTSGVGLASPILPNPAIDLTRPIRLRLRLDSGALRVCVGVRETGVNVPVGQDGGTSGTIEWIGASDVIGGAPQGVLVTAQPGVWQTLTFVPSPGAVRAFTGDAVLSVAHNKGVLEHLAFTSAGTAGPFTVYLDALTQPCPAKADFDFDGDVDQADFAYLQACLSGPGVAQTLPECSDALLDGDTDVDDADVAAFLACMNGPNLPPPAECVP